MSALTDEIVAALIAAAYGVHELVELIPEPSTTPIVTPGGPLPVMTPMANAFLKYNNGESLFANGVTSWTVPLKQVVIHKLTQGQAVAVTGPLMAGAKQYGLDPCYLGGCILIESTGDPNCQNGNAGPGESNYSATNPKGISMLGYDMGAAQLKLKYLIGYAPGVTDEASALAFALDPSKAIPYFCSLMAGKVAYAESIIAKNSSSAPDPRMLNKYVLGTWCYNEGDTGALTDFSNGTFPSHCQQVIDLTNYLAKATGVPSIFANLPT